ncbi:MAG: hypothetical protein FWE24_07030 [Defluviitaleaceae bacterium]|nr:hypothetical protein [Defluviitaleaceae bacterium]
MLYVKRSDFIYKNASTVVTVGNFDGFHRGHRALIEKINKIKLCRGLKSVAFSFNPRPKDVFKGTTSKSILSLEERVEVAKNLDIDLLVEYPFSLEFSRMSGEDFIKNILIGQFSAKELAVGAGFAFGKDRVWNAEKIQEISPDLGIEVIILPHELSNNEKISSTTIREYLKNGEINKANELLGYDYFLKGTVSDIVEKNFIIKADDKKILPKNGEYITETRLEDGKTYQSITNVDSNDCIQTQIRQLKDSLCGETLTIMFKERVNKGF